MSLLLHTLLLNLMWAFFCLVLKVIYLYVYTVLISLCIVLLFQVYVVSKLY